MSHHDIFEDRKRFQLERLILFSDAVFAIVITLLVLEIRVPHSSWSRPITQRQLHGYIVEIIPNLLGFLISFYIIGLYWVVHHRIFGRVVSFDGGVIGLNLLLLFFIALLPFTTTLVSEYGYLSESYVFYWINVGCVGILIYFMWVYISNPKKKLAIEFEDNNHRRRVLGRSLYTSIVFFLGAVFAMTHNNMLQLASRYIYILVLPGIIILNKIYKTPKPRR